VPASVDPRTRGHYYPAVDGLRTAAVLAVIAYHGAKFAAPGGFLGVDVFFVISGFVITLTLLREHERAGRISLWDFYRRRWWRIMPALVACVIFAVVLDLVWRADPLEKLVRQALTAVTYTYNFGQVATHDRGGGILSHMWSLSVEEQFYLVFAPLLAVALSVVVARRKRMRALAGAVVVLAATQAMTVLLWGTLPGFFLPWARFDEFFVGTLLAVALHARDRWETPRLFTSPGPAIGAAVVLVAGMVLVRDLLDRWLFFGGYLVAALLSAVLVGHAYSSGSSPLKAVLSWAPVVWLGQRSYGIYLYHYPVIIVLRYVRVPVVLHAPLGLLIGTGVAAASYRWLETPLRARGQRVPSHVGGE
jgi:peptidoglycan/LPS O-acetylase OafA/YrhL